MKYRPPSVHLLPSIPGPGLIAATARSASPYTGRRRRGGRRNGLHPPSHDGCNGLLLHYATRPAAFHVVDPTMRRRAAGRASCAAREGGALRAVVRPLHLTALQGALLHGLAALVRGHGVVRLRVRRGARQDVEHCRVACAHGLQRFSSSVGTRPWIWELQDAGGRASGY